MAEDLIIYTPMYVTFFWTIVLLSSGNENNRARFFLGVFMLASFLLFTSHVLFFKKNIFAYQYFDSVYIFSSLSVYPLYYWYIKLLTVEPRYRLSNLRLLIPAAFFGLTSVVLYQLMAEGERLAYINSFLLGGKASSEDSILVHLQKWNFIAARMVFAIQVLFFLVHGRKLVLHYNKQIANFYSNLESKTIVWVNYLLYSYVITSLMSIVFNLIGRGVFLDSIYLLFIPSFIFSVLLFFIGLLGYMQNYTVIDLVRDERTLPSTVLGNYDTEQLRENLLRLFNHQKIFRNPELKITDVSRLLGTNRSYISALINHTFSCSFNAFVNEFRVIEAKRFLTDDSPENYSLAHIADSVGFGSVGTFIRVFRYFEGKTPGKYRQDMKSSGI